MVASKSDVWSYFRDSGRCGSDALKFFPIWNKFPQLLLILASYPVFSVSCRILVSNFFIIQNLSKIQPLTLSVAEIFAFVRHFVLSDMPYLGNAINQQLCLPDRRPTLQKLIKRLPEVFYDRLVCPPGISERSLKTGRGTGSSSGGREFHQKVPETGAKLENSTISKSYQNHIEIIKSIITKSQRNHLKMTMCFFL